MRSRAQRVLLVLVVLLAIVGYATVPYARALSLIVRGAHLGGPIESFATDHAYRVAVRPAHTVPTRHGDVRAQFYIPDKVIGHPVIVIPGVHSAGIDEGRLTALSAELAATGLTVMTIALPDLQAYRITPNATDTIEDAVSWLAGQQPYAPDGKVGVVGISFAGGLSVSAASRASIKDRLAYVVSFGGHADLPRVMRYLATGEEAAAPGVTVPPPHDYGVGVVLHALADRGVVPAGQVAALREGIGVFLLGSQETVLTPDLAVQTFARAREFERALPEPSRTYLHYVNERDTKKLGAVLAPHLDQLGADDPALSPDRTPQVPTAPVYLLHGIEDTVIPAVESALLADNLRRRGAEVHLLLSGLITHAEVSKNVPVSETLKLVSFWASVPQAVTAQQQVQIPVTERLQKILSQAGIASRRASEQLIAEGRVTVNGTTIREMGVKADISVDDIRVDGRRIKGPQRHRYILLNKPAGYVTTRSDPQRRRTVLDLLGGVREYVYPVGRLDYDTEGLLILTNDGDLAARLTHPRHGVARSYEARVAGMPDQEAIDRLRHGIPLDGHRTQPASVVLVNKAAATRLASRREPEGVLLITIREGRNRQVRRMCEAVGHPVKKLVRRQIGPIRDRQLKPGEWRDLRPEEVRALQREAEDDL